MIEQIKAWCDERQYKYECGRNYCDCVDYDLYINVFISKTDYRFTLYHHINHRFSLNFYHKKELIAILANINELKDITDFLDLYLVGKRYSVAELDNTYMSVKEFLENEKAIPYWKIYANDKEISLADLQEKYIDKDIYFYNDPKDFGTDCEGNSDSFDRLFAEVQL